MNPRIFAAVALTLAAATSWAAAAAPTDPEIVGIVSVANQGELDAAKLAEGRTKNADVKRFAEHMIKDHGDAKMKLSAVAEKSGLTASDGADSAALTSHNADEAKTLNAAPDEQFDRAYMDAQLADHATLLKKLDEELIPNAKDPALRDLLHKVRGVVSHHLALARKILAKMKAS
jgi:putative membrane protein